MHRTGLQSSAPAATHGVVVLLIAAAESVAQLSEQLSEAQEQMVRAAVSSQHTTPERSQKARMLEVRHPVCVLQL
jgi:hypothetical protein